MSAGYCAKMSIPKMSSVIVFSMGYIVKWLNEINNWLF